MVSFHCNGCTDVIKKPKLDQHYYKCKSSVDCIDCSKTFNSPAEWKSHTSCVTEAEKYQKSLYKGPKTQGESSNGFRGDAGGWGRGRGRGRGGMHTNRGGYGGGPGNRRPYAGTGSNGTPLGSPAREFGKGSTTNTDESRVEKDHPTEVMKGTKRKAAGDGEPANKKSKVQNSDNIGATTDKGERAEKEKEKEGGKKKKERTEGASDEQVEKKKKEKAAKATEKGEEKAKIKAAEKEEKARRKADKREGKEKEEQNAAEKEEKARRKAEKREERARRKAEEAG